MTFDELCVKHNCDKGLLPKGVGHNYGRHFESILEPLRHQPVQLLEIGVGDGKSIRVWLDYFTNRETMIHGVDIDPHCPMLRDDRFQLIRGDQTDAAFLSGLAMMATRKWDVIIDDGSHMPDGTVTALEALWPFVRSEGYYIIEDLKTAYMAGYQVAGWGTQMSFVKRLLDDINAQTNYKPAKDTEYHYPPGTDGGRGIEWLRFSEELVIIRKK